MHYETYFKCPNIFKHYFEIGHICNLESISKWNGMPNFVAARSERSEVNKNTNHKQHILHVVGVLPLPRRTLCDKRQVATTEAVVSERRLTELPIVVMTNRSTLIFIIEKHSIVAISVVIAMSNFGIQNSFCSTI